MQQLGKMATVSSMDEFIVKCEDLHSKIIAIQDQATQYVDKMLKEATIKVSQAVVFKIQEMSFSLKRLI